MASLAGAFAGALASALVLLFFGFSSVAPLANLALIPSAYNFSAAADFKALASAAASGTSYQAPPFVISCFKSYSDWLPFESVTVTP